MFEHNQKNEWVKEEQTNWESLSDHKCPLCSLALLPKQLKGFDYYICTCGFGITLDRFNQLVAEQQAKRLNPDHRKALQAGKKVKFQSAKVFKGERPEKLDLGF